MLYVVILLILNKELMPKISEKYSFLEKIKKSKQLLPVVLLIIAVIGSIYTYMTSSMAYGCVWFRINKIGFLISLSTCLILCVCIRPNVDDNEIL